MSRFTTSRECGKGGGDGTRASVKSISLHAAQSGYIAEFLVNDGSRCQERVARRCAFLYPMHTLTRPPSTCVTHRAEPGAPIAVLVDTPAELSSYKSANSDMLSAAKTQRGAPFRSQTKW
jgi:hypothetical protein